VVEYIDQYKESRVKFEYLEPQWIPIVYSSKSEGVKLDAGKILASFTLISLDQFRELDNQDYPKLKEIETEDFELKLNILGLRGLKSTGLLPVKKVCIFCFIIF
jgi:hypothetical protein